MRKKVSGLILCFALLFALPFPAFAANHVNTMDIQAVIYEDGSMYVTQGWEGNFNEGTESYIPMNAPETLTISQLAVSDQNGATKRFRIGILIGALKKRRENAASMIRTVGMKFALASAGMDKTAMRLNISWTMLWAVTATGMGSIFDL